MLITTERFNKTKVALAGATLMFFLPLINSDEIFYSRDTGVNWDVLFLLLGMMIIVSVVRQTGAFEYVAIWSAKRAKGSPLRIMILLILVTALGTAVLDNVTTVLLIAPVTLLVCDRLAVNPAPFLVIEAIAANIAGAATLVGDPTSIIIGTGAHLTFIEFSANMAPAVLLVLVALIAILPRLYPGFLVVDPERAADVMSLDEKEAIRNPKLLLQCGIRALGGVRRIRAAQTDPHGAIHGGDGRGRDPDCDLGSGTRVLPRQRRMGNAAVLRGTVRHGGGPGADRRHQGTGEDSQPLRPWRRLDGDAADPHRSPSPLGSVINNVPYAAAMTPIVGQFADSIPGHAGSGVLWWALLLGTVLGGNLTPDRRQREHRRGRDRETRRPSRLVLGLHQTRSGSDRRFVCPFARLPVAALLRLAARFGRMVT